MLKDVQWLDCDTHAGTFKCNAGPFTNKQPSSLNGRPMKLDNGVIGINISNLETTAIAVVLTVSR